MTDERRKSQRTVVDEIAYISSSGSSTTSFHLMTERDRIVRSCRIVWIKQNRIGVEFEHALDEQSPITHRERQFLQCLRDAAWQRASSLPDQN
jgi:hypothetical protein